MSIAIGQYTIVDLTDITVSSIAPTSPIAEQLWLDTSATPNILKKYNGTIWVSTAVEEVKNDGGTVTINSGGLVVKGDIIVRNPTDTENVFYVDDATGDLVIKGKVTALDGSDLSGGSASTNPIFNPFFNMTIAN